MPVLLRCLAYVVIAASLVCAVFSPQIAIVGMLLAVVLVLVSMAGAKQK